MGAEVIVLRVNWAENEVVLGGGGWIRASRRYRERARSKTDLSAKANLFCVSGRGPDVRW